MEITIPVYSKQDLSPRASEVIRAIVDSEYPQHKIKFRLYRPGYDTKVIVFGKAPDEINKLGVEYIYTYSVAQLMVKPNSGSVLGSALRQYLKEPEPIPFDSPLPTWLMESGPIGWDFNLPTAIDIETNGALGTEHTPEEVEVISVAFYQPGNPPMVWINTSVDGVTQPLTDRQIELLRLFILKIKYGIYHNGKFDTRVLNRVLGVKLHVWFDTMLAHHTLNHAAGDHKLKTAARRYVGAPEWESDLSKYTKGGAHYELIPLDKLVEYNGYDVYWTYKLYEFFAPQILADEDAQRVLNLEMMAANFLLEVERVGIPVDTKYAISYANELDQEQDRQKRILKALTGLDLNPNSPKQVKDYFHNKGYQIDKADEITLTAIKAELEKTHPLVPIIEAILNFRKAGKIRGTYALGWLGKTRNGRAHPTFNVHGTTTGRLSSTAPNAQNMPRDKEIRKLVRVNGS